MSMLQRFSRLFVIKTRWEVWLVIYAIAVGAVERGRHYLDIYPGALGGFMALACTGVVFLAGAKLLDSVRPVPAPVKAGHYAAFARRRSQGRPREHPMRRATDLPISARGD